MKLKLSKLLYYAMPAALAVFIIAQTIVPLFSKAGDQVRMQTKLISVKNNVRKPATSEAKAPEFVLSAAPNAVYYNYKKDYTCKRSGSKNNIPSHADSFAVVNGQICNLGDACTEETSGCSTRVPEGMEFTKDFAALIYKNQKFNRQKSSIPDSCVMPSCGMPADNCRFDEMAPLDESGCPQGCGTIVCKVNAEQCPILNCAAPPQNCYYDSRNAGVDANGCAKGCGALVCDTISSKEFKCPALSCATPPENCTYDNTGGRDSNGCKTSCGELKCKHVNPKAVACLSEPVCAEPPAGCFYTGTPAIDDKGCRTGCGSMVCKKSTPKQCEQPVCEAPSEFCRYDGNAPLDFKGCSTGCGNLICNSDVPL